MFVLHAKPRRVFGREIDLYVAASTAGTTPTRATSTSSRCRSRGLITIALITSGVLPAEGDRETG